MAEQLENVNAGLEDDDQAEDGYEGDLGDGAKGSSGAGIIGLDASE